MRTRLRATGAWLLIAVLLGGALAPAVAQAAPRQATRAALVWSPDHQNFTAADGRYHEFGVRAWFHLAHGITNARFAIHTSGGISTRPSSFFVRRLDTQWHLLTFTIVVPAGVADGWHTGSVRLQQWEGAGDSDGIGTPFIFRVHVPEHRPVAAVITWAPRPTLGTVTVHRGQTVTVGATATSNQDLTNVQLRHDLGAFAAAHGVSLIASALPATMARGLPYPVALTISADRAARIGLYAADLHVVGSVVPGGAAVRLPVALSFKIDVDAVQAVAARVVWTAPVAPVVVQPGQTVVVTDSFTSTAPLAGALAQGALGSALTAQGVSISLAPVPAVIPAGVPVAVVVNITAAPTARPVGGAGIIHVLAQNASGVLVRVPFPLSFGVKVAVPAPPVVTWTSGSPASFPSITRSITAPVTAAETGTFVASAPLVNAQYAADLNAAAQRQGITITPVPLPAGTTIAPGTPTTASFTLTVPPTAKSGTYAGEVYLTAQPAGSAAPQRIHTALHFVFAVNKG